MFRLLFAVWCWLMVVSCILLLCAVYDCVVLLVLLNVSVFLFLLFLFALSVVCCLLCVAGCRRLLFVVRSLRVVCGLL